MIDRFKKQERKNEIYSDFLTSLSPHPVTGDIVRFVNENAVNRSLRNLIQTNKGERLFQPNVGSDLYKLLFEPMVDSTAELIQKNIQKLIDTHEPRAKVLDITVNQNQDTNSYLITIRYMLLNRPTPVSLDINLTRVR